MDGKQVRATFINATVALHLQNDCEHSRMYADWS